MEQYDLSLNHAVEEIQKHKAKLVCVQLPDGLKPQAAKIQNELEEKTDAEVIIWLGSCWGGCDIPLSVKSLGVDMLIQWGHEVYKRAW